MITDQEYPLRPAFSLLTRILDEQSGLTTSLSPPGGGGGAPTSYLASPPPSNPSTAASGGLSPAQKGKLEATLQSYLTKYQDPKQADTIMKVQAELDETKVVLHKTIESVLERGEKLDNLVERSNALSAQSKMFYKTAKKVGPPCVFPFVWEKDADPYRAAPRSKTRVVSSCDRPVVKRIIPGTYETHRVYEIPFSAFWRVWSAMVYERSVPNEDGHGLSWPVHPLRFRTKRSR